jgi:aconitase A
VRLELGDDWSASRCLRSGSRREPQEAADEASVGLAPGAAAALTQRGPAVVLAGRGFGGGERADELAWALAQAFVVAVIAGGFAPGAVTALAHAGVLALDRGLETWRRLQLGDEIELPGLPHAIEHGRRVVLRNLTRGVSLAVSHPWNAREVRVWRAGGILAMAGATGASVAGD